MDTMEVTTEVTMGVTTVVTTGVTKVVTVVIMVIMEDNTGVTMTMKVAHITSMATRVRL